MYKTPRSLGTILGPFDIAFGRAVGEHEPAGRVRAIMGDNVIGVDDIMLGF